MARRPAWRRLHCWSAASSITLCSTPAHTSIRRCIKSFTSCTFCPVDSLLCPWFCSQLGCSVAKNLESHRGDHDLLDYCTFWNGGSEWYTDCLGKHSMQKRKGHYHNWYCDITTYITNHFRCLKTPIFLLYTLTTGKLRLVLVNMLIGSIFEC